MKFNLSEKVRFGELSSYAVGNKDWILSDDVKEFIRILKGRITNSQLGWEGYTPEDKRISKEVNLIIDELAGDKLI